MTCNIQLPSKLLSKWILWLFLPLLPIQDAFGGDAMFCIGARISRDIPRSINMLKLGGGIYDGHASVRVRAADGHTKINISFKVPVSFYTTIGLMENLRLHDSQSNIDGVEKNR